MPSSHQRPKLAVIVANTITGDSRVQKTALSAAGDGWDVTLIGQSGSDDVEWSTFGPVRIVRLPLKRDHRNAEAGRRQLALQRRAALTGRRYQSREQAAAAHEARLRERVAEVGDLRADAGVAASAAAFAKRAWGKASRVGFRGAIRAYDWLDDRAALIDDATGDWRRDHPVLLDLEAAFVPAIEDLQPDVIHVNDITMLNTGAVAAGRLRGAGHQVKWLYDAHEYVAGVDWPTPRMMSAFPQLERKYIHRADAVVTVSPEIADVIRDEQSLERTPLVVRNTPVAAAVDHSGDVSVRRAAGLAESVPLMVYSGYIHAERGVDTAIDALPSLPEVHLVIVAGSNTPTLRKLKKQAAELGVIDRLHVVPYVAQHQVADYLSSADVGIICSARTINYELSLPTKLAEYLHAGLPILCSDVKTLSAFVRQHDVGSVFTGGDAESFRLALKELLSSRGEKSAHISNGILTELSWEHQSKGLLALYREISGLTPPQPTEALEWDVTERLIEAKHPGPNRPWRQLTRTPIKLGLGPANHAGQLSALATAITQAREDVSAEVVMHTSATRYGYPSDVRIPRRKFRKRSKQIAELERFLPRYTHLIADAFLPVFGGLNGPSIEGDLPALKTAEVAVALLAHGSEIRDPLRHQDSHQYSHYRSAPQELVQAMTEAATHNREVAARSGLPLFVTTPDLLTDVPTATWVPLVVDLDLWASDAPVMARPRPVVLHAPSRRWTKGTDYFINDLERLDSRGLIELRLVEGMPWKQMRDEVGGADIVIDQFGVGSYGAFACEAMAAGRPVIAYLDDHQSDVIGEEPPIVNCTAVDVAAAVEQLLDDRQRAIGLGRAAVGFVKRHHDGARSAEAFQDFLREAIWS